MAVKQQRASTSSFPRGVSWNSETYGFPPHSAPFGTQSAPMTPLQTRRTNRSKKTQASIDAGRLPPEPKKYQPFQSMAMDRRALASTLAIGDTPRRRSNFADDRFAVKMNNSEYERYREWVDGVIDTPDMMCDKLERNAKDNKARMQKLSDSISNLTADMKDFRAVKEDWDGMVDMSTKMVKRKRAHTKDAYERINDANHQIGRELTKNFPYIPYELLVDHQYAASFPARG